MPRIIAYKCNKCGTRVIVSPATGARVRPIYCCGAHVVDITSSLLKSVGPKKKPAKKKPAKTAAKKKIVKKKAGKKK